MLQMKTHSSLIVMPDIFPSRFLDKQRLPSDPKGILLKIMEQGGQHFALYDTGDSPCAFVKYDKTTGMFLKKSVADDDAKPLTQDALLNVLRNTGWILRSEHTPEPARVIAQDHKENCTTEETVSRHQKARDFLHTYASYGKSVASENVHGSRTVTMSIPLNGNTFDVERKIDDKDGQRKILRALLEKFPQYHGYKDMTQPEVKKVSEKDYVSLRTLMTTQKEVLKSHMPHIDRHNDCVRVILAKLGKACYEHSIKS